MLKRKADNFVAYYHSWMEASSPEHMAGRRRDLFPLPPMRTWPLEVPGLPVHEVGLVLSNLCLASQHAGGGHATRLLARTDSKTNCPPEGGAAAHSSPVCLFFTKASEPGHAKFWKLRQFSTL